MIVPCKYFLLLELSVSTVLAHTYWTLVEFTAFFLLPLSVIQTEHISFRLLSASFTIAVKLIFSKPLPTPLISTQYVWTNFRYRPSLLNIINCLHTIPFPT